MIDAKRLYGKSIGAKDGHIGALHDLYFDAQWIVRYLVVDTRKWLPGRKVLIAPEAMAHPWHNEADVPVNLTKDQIRESPDIDTAQPISRKAEQHLHHHYGWIPYWADPAIPAPAPPPSKPAYSLEELRQASREAEAESEQHLRSAKEVMGYHVRATDGDIGHIGDFVVGDSCNCILFLTIDLEEWLEGRQVLLPPTSVLEIDWATSRVLVNVTCQAIRASQAYKPAA